MSVDPLSSKALKVRLLAPCGLSLLLPLVEQRHPNSPFLPRSPKRDSEGTGATGAGNFLLSTLPPWQGAFQAGFLSWVQDLTRG